MFKIRNLCAAAVIATGSVAAADAKPLQPNYSPSVMVGMTFAFGGGSSGLGFSLRLLSSNEPNTAVFAGGVTYFPWAQNHFGVDLGVGMNTNGIVGTLGYDFLQNAPVFSLGGTKQADLVID